MSESILDRIKLLAWLAAFLAPVMALEIGREWRTRWDDERRYSEPTPEFARALAACGVASADR